MSQIVTVLDTNVLVVAPLRDTLLRLAELSVIRVHWSAETLLELKRTLGRRLDLRPPAIEGLLDAFAAAFPEACVAVTPEAIARAGNHPKDRHVAAAAVEAGASHIVTLDRAGFDRLPAGIVAVSPDTFLTELLAERPDDVLLVLRMQTADLVRPPLTLDELLERIGRTAPRFAAAVRARLARERERRR